MASDVRALFGAFGGVMAVACLEGRMGRVLAARGGRSAAAELGDFAFFAGEPAEELLRATCAEIVVAQNARWRALRPQWRAFPRWAFGEAPADVGRLRERAAVPAGYELRALDAETAALCRAQEWSRDLAAGHMGEGCEGFVLLRGGEVCAGAAAYARSSRGASIQVDTRADLRRRGLAGCCAANYILRCLERGLWPEWDAHTRASAALAESLGYGGRREYTALLRGGQSGA